MLCLFSVGGRRTVSEPSIQLTDGGSCATEAGNATVFGPPYLEAREQEPPFVPQTCSPLLLGLLAKILICYELRGCRISMTNKNSTNIKEINSVYDDVSGENSLDLCTPVFFSPSSPEWDNCEVPGIVQSLSPEKPLESSSDVPKILCDFVICGARFETIPKFTWNMKDSDRRVRLRKELSVVFSVHTLVTSEDVIVGFDAAGIDVDQILSIQCRASNNSWVVSFRFPEAKNVALVVPCVTISGCTVFIGDCENRVQIVKIYEAPTEMPDTVLIGCLSHYGKVFSFWRDKVADSIYNGVRTARMRLNLTIPPTIFVAGELIRIWYPTQPKMCRRCGDSNHVVAKCSSFRCFNCEAPGHRIEDCRSSPLCLIYLAAEHDVSFCPFLLYSANVVAQPGDSLVPDEPISQPVALPSYAKVVSHSP